MAVTFDMGAVGVDIKASTAGGTPIDDEGVTIMLMNQPSTTVSIW